MNLTKSQLVKPAKAVFLAWFHPNSDLWHYGPISDGIMERAIATVQYISKNAKARGLEGRFLCFRLGAPTKSAKTLQEAKKLAERLVQGVNVPQKRIAQGVKEKP